MGLNEVLRPVALSFPDAAPSGPPPSDSIPPLESHMAEFRQKFVPRPYGKFRAMLDKASSPDGLQNSTDHQVYEAYGIHGVGRSTFLKQFEAVCQDRYIPYCNLSLKGDRSEMDANYELASIMRIIATRLTQKLLRFPKFNEARARGFELHEVEGEQFEVTPPQPEYYEEFFKDFIADLRDYTEDPTGVQRPVVIALDDIDQLRPEVFKRLRKQIMEPLTSRNGNRVIFVLTGIRPIAWERQPDAIRRVVHQDELREFDIETMARQLELYRPGWGKFTHEIHEITHGYPAATNMVCRLLADIEPSHGEVNADLIESQKVHLLTRVIEDLIDEQVLKPHFPLEEQEKLVRAFHLAAVAGRLNMNLLQKLLHKFISPQYKFGEVITIMGNFLSTGLVNWGDEGYRVEPAVANMCDTHLRLANPDRYRQVHQWLIDYYKSISEHDSDEAKRVLALQ